jgi:hypothetical protein
VKRRRKERERERERERAGVTSTTASYNASAVKIHNATCSLVRFENKSIFFYFGKFPKYVVYYNAGVVGMKLQFQKS